MNILESISTEYGKTYVPSYIPWDQSENGLIGVTSQTKNGACAAYCLYWLKSLYEGQTSFPPDFKTKLAAINTQLSFYQKDWVNVFSDSGVTINKGKVDWLQTESLPFVTKNASKTITDMIGTINTSFVIQLVLKDNSSHLIALISKDTTVSLFDPNYGLVVFLRSFTNTFMENYFEGFNQVFNNSFVKINTYQTDGDFNLAPLFS